MPTICSLSSSTTASRRCWFRLGCIKQDLVNAVQLNKESKGNIMDAVIPNASTSNTSMPRDYLHIQGWGADLDHENRPAYPKERTPPRLEGLHWAQPEQQAHGHMEIFHSTERPGITPLFGTTVPPSGLSGALRRFAFKYSEN